MAHLESYFDWLVGQVKGCEKREFLRFLFDLDFVYTLELDKNRAKDGLILRKIWKNSLEEEGIRTNFEAIFEEKPECSVLEMVLGVAIRMEDLLYIPGQDQIWKWFWELIENSEWEETLEKSGHEACKKQILAWTCGQKSGGWPNIFKNGHFFGHEIWYQMHDYVAKYHHFACF